jgi:hypothetical protein
MHKKPLNTFNLYTENQRHKGANAKQAVHSARPPALLDVSPCLYQELAMRRQPYYFSTHNAGLAQYKCGRKKPLL